MIAAGLFWLSLGVQSSGIEVVILRRRSIFTHTHTHTNTVHRPYRATTTQLACSLRRVRACETLFYILAPRRLSEARFHPQPPMYTPADIVLVCLARQLCASQSWAGLCGTPPLVHNGSQSQGITSIHTRGGSRREDWATRNDIGAVGDRQGSRSTARPGVSTSYCSCSGDKFLANKVKHNMPEEDIKDILWSSLQPRVVAKAAERRSRRDFLPSDIQRQLDFLKHGAAGKFVREPVLSKTVLSIRLCPELRPRKFQFPSGTSTSGIFGRIRLACSRCWGLVTAQIVMRSPPCAGVPDGLTALETPAPAAASGWQDCLAPVPAAGGGGRGGTDAAAAERLHPSAPLRSLPPTTGPASAGPRTSTLYKGQLVLNTHFCGESLLVATRKLPQGVSTHHDPIQGTCLLKERHAYLTMSVWQAQDASYENSHQSDPVSIPGRVASGFPYVGMMPHDAVGQRVFSVISHFPALAFQCYSILTSLRPHRLSRPRNELTTDVRKFVVNRYSKSCLSVTWQHVKARQDTSSSSSVCRSDESSSTTEKEVVRRGREGSFALPPAVPAANYSISFYISRIQHPAARTYARVPVLLVGGGGSRHLQLLTRLARESRAVMLLQQACWPDCYVQQQACWPDCYVQQQACWPDCYVQQQACWPDCYVQQQACWPDCYVQQQACWPDCYVQQQACWPDCYVQQQACWPDCYVQQKACWLDCESTNVPHEEVE
ncbi:hypothetical protein PR048_003465 [Dryococelus australis]|uniref:Uncharacterized protein n=1 Tax=Dryococelus australis TaxID=614101 RepID=A0ABQ9IPK5_9NEOP|nr:hypothetical protein PR048_003465 [Dryococelus australis]